MPTIVEMKLDQVSQRLNRHYGLTTHIEESLFDVLTTACLLNQQILPVLSQQLLTHMAAKQKPITLTLGWAGMKKKGSCWSLTDRLSVIKGQ